MATRNGEGWMRAGRGAALALAVLTYGAASGLEARDLDKKAVSQFKLAYSYYEGGRLPEALTAVDKALKDEPKYAQAHLLRGMILDMRGATDQALAEFEKTLSLDKKYTDARLYRGSALARMDRKDEAMKEFETALKDLSYPYPEKVHTNIGWLKRMEGDLTGALQSLQEAVRLNSSHARAYYELGLTYDTMGKEPEALRAYQDALVGMDGSPDLHLKLGLAMMKTGSPTKARQHLEKVLKISPDGPQAEEARQAINRLKPQPSPS
ncbi:MAG: tetratricopeptide repeat protein [Candidatus Polarisedimenticolia bacterium]